MKVTAWPAEGRWVQGKLLSLGESLVGRHTYSWCLPNVIILDCFIVTEVMKPANVCLVCVMLGWARLVHSLLKEKESRVHPHQTWGSAGSPRGLLWVGRRECLLA